METKYLKINPADNVVVAISDLKAGETITVDGHVITLKEDVPAGHKVTLKDFAQGENIIKYGYPIGHALTAVEQGHWINENQIKTNLAGLLDYTYNPVSVDLNIPKKDLTFKGYRRKNGDVGIRNEVWIIPTVGCVNGIIGQLAEALRRETNGEGVDAIMAFPHNYGCSQLGDDHENTKKILRDMILHPNAGAVLIVSLGCENNQPDVFREFLGDYDTDRVKFMVTQKVGDEFEEGMKILRELYAKAKADVETGYIVELLAQWNVVAGHRLEIEQSLLVEELFVVTTGSSVRVFFERVADSQTYGELVDHEIVELGCEFEASGAFRCFRSGGNGGFRTGRVPRKRSGNEHVAAFLCT